MKPLEGKCSSRWKEIACESYNILTFMLIELFFSGKRKVNPGGHLFVSRLWQSLDFCSKTLIVINR